MFKKIKCNHKNSETLTNIHGDAINYLSSINKIYRSQRKCRNCGKIYFSEYLDKDCKNVNMFYWG